MDATLERAAAYRAAGADGIFVPGTVDPATVRELVAAIDGPLNILVGPAAPSVSALADLGVARVSAGSSLAQGAYGAFGRAARELLEAGTFTAPTGAVGYTELNGLLTQWS